MYELPLRKVMTSQVVTVDRNKTLDEVLAIFANHNFHHLPVVDEQSCLKGMISLTDIERLKVGASFFRIPDKAAYTQSLFEMIRVCEVMTKDVVKLRPSDSIRKAYEVFRENKFRALPIVDKGKLVGIVTPIDLLHHFFNERAAQQAALELQEYGRS